MRKFCEVEASGNAMAHSQKPDFVFRRNGRVHLNRQGRQFSRLLAAELCASAIVMLDTPCSEVVWRVLTTHSIREFPLHFPRPCVTVCHHILAGVYHRRKSANNTGEGFGSKSTMGTRNFNLRRSQIIRWKFGLNRSLIRGEADK